MSTLEAEKDLENTVQVKEAVEIIDCGCASERTQGTQYGVSMEVGIPPSDKLFFW